MNRAKQEKLLDHLQHEEKILLIVDSTSSRKQIKYQDLSALTCHWVGGYRGPVPSPGHWFGLHNPVCVVWLIESGQVRIETESGVNTYGSDTWILQMPGLRLSQIFSEDAQLLSLRFLLKWQNGRMLFRPQQRERSCSLGQYPVLKQAALDFLAVPPKAGDGVHFSETLMHADDAWAIAAAEANFLQHWYRCACDIGFEMQESYLADRRVASGVAVLQEQLANSDVPYLELMERTGVSRAQLDRIFHKHLGHSPKREHDLLRLAHAQEQLQIHERPIKQIAADLGFYDASQFAKWFRRLDGRNPSQARFSSDTAV